MAILIDKNEKNGVQTVHEVNHEPWGILLIASGTRSLVGQRQTQNFAAGLKRRMGRQVPVVTAYLEVQEPSLRTVLPIIDDLGIQHWLCVPLFLFSAGYTVFDRPVWAARFLLFRRPHLNLRWMPAWGTERQLISVAAGYVYRLLLDFDEAASTVVLVGGASSSLHGVDKKYADVLTSGAEWLTCKPTTCSLDLISFQSSARTEWVVVSETNRHQIFK